MSTGQKPATKGKAELQAVKPNGARQSPYADSVRGSRYRFNSQQYLLMIEAEILSPGDRVELLEGEIHYMPPMGREHAYSIGSLDEWFQDRRGNDYIVSCQSTIHLAEGFSPDPDIVLLRGTRQEYRLDRVATVEDVLLVIEVSKSSLRRDLAEKSREYARAAVPELWVADVAQRQIHKLTGPSPEGYLTRQVLEATEAVSPVLLPHLQMPVGVAMPR